MTNPHVNLWPHQIASIEAVRLAIAAERGRGLVVLPTGTGKTITVMALARELGWKTLFLVHRDRLILQTVKAAAVAWPEATQGVIKGSRDEWRQTLWGGAPDLVVASVQSLTERRLSNMPRGRFDLVVCDEAHHAPAPNWARVLEWFESKFRLGVTATPTRLDKKGLSPFFGPDPLYSYSLFSAIADGHLCGVDSRAVDTKLDLGKIGKVSDFKLNQLSKAVNTPQRNQQVLDAWLEHGEQRRTIAFACDVEHCENLAQRFASAGIKTDCVHSKKGDRRNDAILDAFAAGQLQVLMSCETLTEGFDDPGVSCILMARPTMSRALYIQMVGRGLRKAKGKRDCRIIDITDNHDRHKLACSLDLFGKRKRPVSAAGDKDAAADREKGPPLDTPILSWQLKESCPWPELPTLDNYVSVWPSDDEPASEAQLRFVGSFGIRVKANLTRGEASFLINRCQEFEAVFPRPATEPQRQVLIRAGLWRDGISKSQASVMIGAMKASVRAGVEKEVARHAPI